MGRLTSTSTSRPLQLSAVPASQSFSHRRRLDMLLWSGMEIAILCNNSQGNLLATYSMNADGDPALVPGSMVVPQVWESDIAVDPSGAYLALARVCGRSFRGSNSGLQVAAGWEAHLARQSDCLFRCHERNVGQVGQLRPSLCTGRWARSMCRQFVGLWTLYLQRERAGSDYCSRLTAHRRLSVEHCGLACEIVRW